MSIRYTTENQKIDNMNIRLFYTSFFLFMTTLSLSQSTWNTLKTGAGGWITGLHIHPSGQPVYARSDVGSAYRWNPDTEGWTNIVTSEQIPSGDVYWDKFSGVLSIVSAPSNHTIAYLAYYDGIYRSTNQGDTWIKTNLQTMEMRPNDDGSKLSGERLAVDPANSELVYFGSIDEGLWYTENGGSDWTEVTTLPDGATGRGVRQILFDENSGTTGGRTNRIYVFIDEEGVYISENAGTSWSLSSFGVNDPWFYDAEISVDGQVYISGESATGTSFGIYQYNGLNWRQVFSDDLSIAMGEIAVDPFDANRIFIFSYGFSDTYRSENINANTPVWSYLTNNNTANSIPWLAWTDNNWFSIGEILMDPIVPDRLWKADGIGVWKSDDVNDSDMTWEERSKAQEHLVSNDLIALSDSRVVTAHWDRPLFYHEDINAYPAIHQPSNRFNSSWDIDQSPTDENYLVAIIEDHRYCCFDENTRSSGYSEDGGETWTKFSTMPDPGVGNLKFGMIAVAAENKDNIVWLPVFNEMPYYTLDRGETWTQVTLPGNSGNCCLAANYFKRRALTADRVLDQTFYIYDFGDGSVFKSSDGGASWIRYAEVLPAFAYNVKLTSVPGQANHLLFAKGAEQAINLIGPLSRSTDGGQSWTDFANTSEVLNVAVGKAEEGADYPTIFIYGRVNGELGYWMTTDEGVSWQQIGDYPMGIYDWPAIMEGDMNEHGRLYIGFNGNGFAYHELDGVLPVSFLEQLHGWEERGKHVLKWSTEERYNFSHFEIERSAEGQYWDRIGAVNALSETVSLQQFQFLDDSILNGKNYYRLRIVDQDGTYSFSNIIIIETVFASKFELFPNPSSGQIFIHARYDPILVEVLDMNQRVVSNYDSEGFQDGIDVSKLADGLYFVRCWDRFGNFEIEKMIKH